MERAKEKHTHLFRHDRRRRMHTRAQTDRKFTVEPTATHVPVVVTCQVEDDGDLAIPAGGAAQGARVAVRNRRVHAHHHVPQRRVRVARLVAADAADQQRVAVLVAALDERLVLAQLLLLAHLVVDVRRWTCGGGGRERQASATGRGRVRPNNSAFVRRVQRSARRLTLGKGQAGDGAGEVDDGASAPVPAIAPIAGRSPETAGLRTSVTRPSGTYAFRQATWSLTIDAALSTLHLRATRNRSMVRSVSPSSPISLKLASSSGPQACFSCCNASACCWAPATFAIFAAALFTG